MNNTLSSNYLSKPALKGKRIQRWFVLLGTALYFTVGLLTVNRGLSFCDEGFFLESCGRILDGQVPFRDFYCSYAPGRFYVGAFIKWCVGDSLVLLRSVLLLLWLLIPLCVLYVCRFFLPLRFHVIPLLLVALYQAPYYNRFFPLALLLAFSAQMRFLQKTDVRGLSYMGLSLMAAFWLRQDLGIAAMVASVALLIMSSGRFARSGMLKNAAILLGPLTISLLPLLVCYMTDHAFARGIRTTLEFALTAYAQRWTLPYPDFFSTFLDGRAVELGLWQLLWRSLFPMQVLLCIVHSLLLIVFIVKGKCTGESKETTGCNEHTSLLLRHVLLVYWQFVSLYYVSFRTSDTHFFMSAAATYIALGYLIRLAWYQGAVLKGTVKAIMYVLALVMLVYWGLLIRASFTIGDFFSGSPGILRSHLVPTGVAHLDVLTTSQKAEQLQEAEHILSPRASWQKAKGFIALPCFSTLGVALRKPNPFYYIWLTPDVIHTGVQQAFLRQFEANQLPYIVAMDMKIDDMDTRRFSNYAPLVWQAIHKHYAPIATLGNLEWNRLTLFAREPGKRLVDIAQLLTTENASWRGTQGEMVTLRCKGKIAVRTLDSGTGTVPSLILWPGSGIEVTLMGRVFENAVVLLRTPLVYSIKPGLEKDRRLKISYTVKHEGVEKEKHLIHRAVTGLPLYSPEDRYLKLIADDDSTHVHHVRISFDSVKYPHSLSHQQSPSVLPFPRVVLLSANAGN